MARVQKFWNDFVRDPEPLQKSQSFSLLLWQGITAGETRQRIWTQVGERALDEAENTEEPLSRAVSDDIVANVEVELEQAHFSGLTNRVPDDEMKRICSILIQHSQRNEIHEYAQGSASLAAILLGVTKDERAAVGVLEHLRNRMANYRANNMEVLMNDVLVLADVLTQELPQLCEHFNQCSFDVVDLGDLVRTWCKSFFASYFPVQIVVRLLDVLMFEEPDCLIGVVFGVLKGFARAICDQPKEDLFQFMTNLPAVLTEQQIQSAMRTGFEMFRVGQTRINALRNNKSWSRTLTTAGPVKYVRNVGEEEEKFEAKLGAVLQSREAKHQPSDALGDSKSSENIQIRTPNAGNNLPDVLFTLEKYRRSTLEPQVARLLEDASREIRKQHEANQALQADLKLEREKLLEQGLSGEASSAESSMSSMDSGSDVDDFLSSGTEAATDRPRSRRRETMPVGTVKYSKLYQHQQFPCLYMEGYLLKARRKARSRSNNNNNTNVFGNLHRRFFVLQGSFVTYFKSHRNSKPSRDISVDMRGRKITRLDKHKFGRYGFEISEVGSQECVYLLFASNSDERNVWVQVLHAATEAG